MESIGELAQRTGTSRRMLRHWEAVGLIAPATVDPWTNRRHYVSAQAGRVRAIAALRSVGFGLDTIRDLLDQGLTQDRLLELLRERETELTDRIAEDSTALALVQTRLRSIERDRSTIMTNLTIQALPETRLRGVTETVTDEAEIPDAVGRLLTSLGADAPAFPQDVLLAYDGTTDDRVIVVSAALLDAASDSTSERATATIVLPSADQAAIAHFEERPASTADAWIALDAELDTQGLRATGPYRQTLHTGGAVTLATPVTAATECA